MCEIGRKLRTFRIEPAAQPVIRPKPEPAKVPALPEPAEQPIPCPNWPVRQPARTPVKVK